MNRLQLNFYIVFPSTSAPFTPVLINLEFLNRLLANAKFVKVLKDERGEFPSDMEKENYFKQVRHLKKMSVVRQVTDKYLDDFELALPYIQRMSKLVDLPFIPMGHTYDDEVYLPTERFFWKFPTVNLGSSRHLMLLDLQVKGSGRNPLSVRMDYHHTWGGNYLYQSLKGYYVSHLFRGLVPQGILETCMVSVEHEGLGKIPVKNSSMSLQFRELQALRISQIMTEFDPSLAPSQKEILKHTLSNSGSKSSRELLDSNLFSYASMFLLGLQHLSVTRENITVEGKLIDYEDVDLVKTVSTQRVQVYVKYPRSKGLSSAKITSIFDKRMAGVVKQGGLFTSTAHILSFAAELSLMGLLQLDPKLKISPDKVPTMFRSMIGKVAAKLFTPDKLWLSFVNDLLKYRSARTPDMLYDESGSKVYGFLNKYRKHIIAEAFSDGADFIMATITFELPCKLWPVNPLVQKFNSQRYGSSVESMVDVCMKKLQLRTLVGRQSILESLEFSSECHKELARRSQIFPYKYGDGKIQMVETRKRDFLSSIEQTCHLPRGSFKLKQVHCFDDVDRCLTVKEFQARKGPLIAYAVTLKLQHGMEYVLNLKPQLVSV